MNYFPGNTQKNSQNGELLNCRSTLATCKVIWWRERLLLLPWRNLPSPPQGRNRETTDGGKERRQSTVGKSWFSLHNTSLLISVSKQPERQSQMSACYVSDVFPFSPCRDGFMTEHMTSASHISSIYWTKCMMSLVIVPHARWIMVMHFSDCKN